MRTDAAPRSFWRQWGLTVPLLVFAGLSGLFWFLTLLAYLKAATGERKGRWLAAALAAYVFSLLSKAIGITLPFVLLALDVYPLRRLGGGAGQALLVFQPWRIRGSSQ